MAKTFVISGGNSGIGLEVGRQLAAQGHHPILLGRDAAKGAAAERSVKEAGGSATFIASDLSTHAGVRDAAEAVRAKAPTIDGLILGAGVLMMREQRTADGLHPIFAVNFLSRYHLTQLLLPTLKQAADPTVVLLVAGVSLSSTIDFSLFPKFAPFPGTSSLSSIQIANYHYVQHLAKAEPTVRAAVVNVGLVKTEIMRDMPAPMKLLFTLGGPLFTIRVEKSASNAAWLATHDGWESGVYLQKPGSPQTRTKLALDGATTERVVAISRDLTGA